MLLHPLDRARALLRTVRPQHGALANAREAVRAVEQAAVERRELALTRARCSGPMTWEPVEAGEPGGDGHAVHFYVDEAALIARLTSYVADGLAAGQTCLVAATASRLAGLRQSLALSGLHDEPGRLVVFDTDEVLRRFMRDDWPDPELFDLAVGEVVRESLRSGAPVRACGDMAGVLHAQGRLPAALQVEKLWGSLLREVRLPLLCAYPVLGDPEEHAETRASVLARHTHEALLVG